jgi:Ni,Fe-hydrogenase I large subunit
MKVCFLEGFYRIIIKEVINTKKIVINPVTRISGFMEINSDIDNNIVVDARTEGLLFRGFEKMLEGRSPFDAVYFTQRICGICSTAHSVASTMALEDALGIPVLEQGKYLRDIIHGCEFLQNHIRHFYQYTAPDFIRFPEGNTLFEADHDDFRLPQKKNDIIVRHYFDSLVYSRNAHEMLAILGGKAPHHHAHMAGCMAESKLTHDAIGVIYDGTGFGMDNAVWGGEFLVGSLSEFTRFGHLEYVTLQGSDSVVKEPWRCAACYLFALDIDPRGFYLK